MPENKQFEPPLTRHRPFYKTPLFWLIFLIILIAGTVFAILYFTKKPTPTEQSTTSTTTVADRSASSSTSSDSKAPTAETPTTQASSEDSSTSPDGKTPTQYDGENPNSSEVLTGYLSAARFSNDKLVLRVTIDQYLSGGTCSLILTDGTNNLEKSANLVPVVSTSTCEGFDVAVSELASFTRPIHVLINLTSGDKTGVIEGGVE